MSIDVLLSLGLMWKGMLTIFAVILVIYLVVLLLLRFARDPGKKDS